MAALQYLTVQDVLWINLRVTGSPQEFDYADLEEATYYQYGYGESKSLLPQAARFLSGYLKKKPFAAGNEATAFVGCLAFLRANGVELTLENPLEWFRAIEGGTHDAIESLAKDAQEAHDHHLPDVREAMASVLTQHAVTVTKLAGADA